MTQSKPYILIVAIAFLVLALAPWPYGFYVLLRFVVSVTAGYYAYLIYQHSKTSQSVFWVMAVVTVLYNPIVPVYLYDKGIWTVLNLVTIPALIWGSRKAKSA